jgi:hypothetical protein
MSKTFLQLISVRILIALAGIVAAARLSAASVADYNVVWDSPSAVLVNRDSVRHSLGCLKGQDAGFTSDLTLAWRGTAYQEGGTTFFRSKISWRGRPTPTCGHRRASPGR